MQNNATANSNRAEQNRLNAEKSTGPKTEEGKQRASQNSLKHGYYSDVDKLDPRDAPAYQHELNDLRDGLKPGNPVEDKLIRELAMLSARLQRLEAVEFALIAGQTEGDPNDARELAEAYLRAGDDLDKLHRTEVYLRRAHDRTWARLERLRKERLREARDSAAKRSQSRADDRGGQAAPRRNEAGLSEPRSDPNDGRGPCPPRMEPHGGTNPPIPAKESPQAA